MAESLPRPKAIVVISAHWLTTGKTLVTAMQQPRTIHDFGRMDARLFEIEYPAPGAPELAQRIAQQISHTRIVLDETWGLDHGAWCPLSVMYPQADIPVIQLSMDYTQPPAEHYALALEMMRPCQYQPMNTICRCCTRWHSRNRKMSSATQ